MAEQKEIIIVGGGMVGAACALGLAQQGWQVQVIEHNALPNFDPIAPYDLRISAISVASVNLLKLLGAWQHIEKMRVYPYRGLETWEIDGFSTHFNCRELNLPELGFMVENNVIQRGLWQCFKDYPNLTANLDIKVKEAHYRGQNWTIFLDNGEQISAPIVIAADGANSQFRQLADIGLTGWQYRQSCLLILVETELHGQDTTWQQFFPSGPRAFLPLDHQQACLVWYDSPSRIRELKQLNPNQLEQQIEQHFPARLGKIKVLNANSFELTRRHAQDYVKQGVVLVGDAAHTINPLAGQGVNLGFKDVKALLEVAQNARQQHLSLADEATLARYQRQRKADNLLMQSGMDFFYKAFKEDLLPLKLARNLALLVADKATPIKKRALKYALGL
ncbi:MAG: FAD-dependent monooxygenase [Pasteurellaceae bacterium]|nr:FAD-dependent monooxygenase [Pasteurellaceae bacterium]